MKSGLTALLSLALGAAMVAAPSVTNIGADAPYDLAFAAKGGNGKGNGGGNKGASASTAGAGNSGKTNHGATASAMGALNAGHASAQAFANALAKQSTSRVGRIAAYAQQNMVADQLATAAVDAAAAAATATAALPGLQTTAATSAQGVLDAQLPGGLMETDPTAYAALQAQAAADALAVTNAQATIDAAAAAQEAADAAEAEAVNLLDAAANKTPVSEDTRAALDALLEGKITAPPAP